MKSFIAVSTSTLRCRCTCKRDKFESLSSPIVDLKYDFTHCIALKDLSLVADDTDIKDVEKSTWLFIFETPTNFPSSNLIIELVLIAQIGTISGIDPVGYIRVKFANFDGI